MNFFSDIPFREYIWKYTTGRYLDIYLNTSVAYIYIDSIR